ncbi:hypothetical protein EH220_01145 [bacterium]|nr:MAG: hypothetical protein EH220_01145 [bacterium]
MRIEPTRNLIAGLDPRENPAHSPDTVKENNIPPPSVQGDRIDIALKSNLSITNLITENSEISRETQLSPERTAEIQTRLKSGFYGTDHVLGQATDGILELYSG